MKSKVFKYIAFFIVGAASYSISKGLLVDNEAGISASMQTGYWVGALAAMTYEYVFGLFPKKDKDENKKSDS